MKINCVVIFVSALLAIMPKQIFAQSCDGITKEALSVAKATEAADVSAQKLMKRLLTAKERRVLVEVAAISKKKKYTAADVVAENNILKEAGLLQDEIDMLRKKNIIGNHVIEVAKDMPTSVVVKEIDVRAVDSAALTELQKGGKKRYYLSLDGRVYVSAADEAMPPNAVGIVKSSKEGGVSFVVKESGELIFDKEKKQFVFDADYGPEVSKLEVEEMLNDVTKMHPGFRNLHIRNMADNKVSAFDCLDILSAQTKGKSFIRDRMIADNVVTLSALGTSEVLGAGRLDTAEGREIIRADIVGTNISSLFNGTIGQKLVLKDANLVTSTVTRATLGYGYIKANEQLYGKVLLNTNAEERAEEIANFDTGHFAARLVVNHKIDKFLIQDLPLKIFNACQNGSTARFFVSPRAVRIYERYGSALIYYGARKAIVGE
jgi:hypothetical protein